jgi:hypothetical protein
MPTTAIIIETADQYVEFLQGLGDRALRAEFVTMRELLEETGGHGAMVGAIRAAQDTNLIDLDDLHISYDRIGTHDTTYVRTRLQLLATLIQDTCPTWAQHEVLRTWFSITHENR